ncbi:MAG: hypothetical protein H6985_15050 [Pseudomonadales bacterium]|nr:hypothetical protein [Pseudomonadales bacterium]
MHSRPTPLILTVLVSIALVACAQQSNRPDLAEIAAPQPAASAPQATAGPVASWPRNYTLGATSLRVFQPQIESWSGNQLSFRVAADASTNAGGTDKKQDYGVFWGTARTDVDRPQRLVTLNDINISRSNFPTLADNGASLLNGLQQQFADTTSIVSLDLLQASLVASDNETSCGVAVRNVAPAIIVSNSPAILVPVSGKPVIKDVPDSRFERVLNTRALIIRTRLGDTWYLHVYDGWLSAPAVAGPWVRASDLPGELDSTAEKLAGKGEVDLLDGGSGSAKPSLANGVPTIYVRESAAELVVFRGEPRFQGIPGTQLQWANNTTADVIQDTAGNDYYLLISGRWYRSANLDAGPWTYIASTSLPADFKRIPPESPAAVVLAAVAGTPQAREAVIANSIPQTATIPLENGPTFTPEIDGAAQWRVIDGTDLQYVINSETPIIKVSPGTLYALSAGVWFTANALDATWVIATSVPQAIYTIPPSSKLYYTTFVYIYGATDQYVYVGYTPGYMGTVVNSDGVVVYGTGYNYEPWVGTTYYAAPETYGTQAQPVYNPSTDMAYAYGMGLTTAAMMYAWDEPVYYTSYYHGYPCCGSTSANVYGHYGDTSYSGKDTYYSKSSGEVGVKSSGDYTDSRTGTTGTYSTNRYTNPYQGQAGRSYDRSFDTAGGASGDVNRSETYNANHNQTSYSASGTATTQGGSTITRDSSASWGSKGDSSSHDTTVTNANTGQTKSFDSGYSDGDHYASANGENYRNDGSGWQKQSDDGSWQSVSAQDSSWADREQQARSQGQARASSFSAGSGAGAFGSGDRSSSYGGGNFGGGDRAGSLGGGAERSGGFGGGWGSRFGGGGFGGRFGGGGGFGGFHGRR